MSTRREELHDLLDDLLVAAVQEATGIPTARPREGQLRLSHDILDTMLGTYSTESKTPGHLAGQAPTGSGKSLSYLAPAMLMAAENKERTVISTESLALQGQILDKDAPAVAAAAEKVLGFRPRTEVLKGWGNYACFGPDVEFITRNGLRRFRDAVGSVETVLDGDGNWTDAVIKSFGVQKIVRLTLGRGTTTRVIETTDQHRWFRQPNADRISEECTTADLKAGDRLAYRGPHNRSHGNMTPSTFGIAHGIVFGDGTRFRSTDGGAHDGACRIELHGEKNWPLASYFNGAAQSAPYRPRPEYAEDAICISGLPSFFKNRPDLDVNTSYLYGWLAGYFAADGTVDTHGCPSISSSKLSNLEFVTAVCAHLGIDHGTITSVERVGKAGDGLPRTLYRLNFEARSLDSKLFLIDEHRERFDARKSNYRREQAARRWTVRAIEYTDERKEVYCAVVPTTHSFTIAGNILTGNCTARTVAAAHVVLDDDDAGEDLVTLAMLIDDMLATGPTPILTGTGRVAKSKAAVSQMDTLMVDGYALPREELLRLLSWTLKECSSPDDRAHPADKHSYDGMMTDGKAWSAVSISPAECPGADSCPFGQQCKPTAGRLNASEADIMVTNHSMLSVQAALNVPVVIGNRKLGLVRHIVMDEAHALASNVRSAGARTINARRVIDLKKSFERIMGFDNSTTLASLTTATEQAKFRIADSGEEMAQTLDKRLAALASTATKSEKIYKVQPDDDPLSDGIAEMLIDWCGSMKRNIPAPDMSYGLKQMMTLRRAHSRIDGFVGDLNSARQGHNGTARWVEPGPNEQPASRFSRALSHAALKVSPVEISGALRANVYVADVLAASDGGEDSYIEHEDEDGYRDIVKVKPEWAVPEGEWCDPGNEHEKIPPRYALSVSALSATLPSGFCFEVGLNTRTIHYPSPFGDAYARSIVYVARAVADVDVAALTSPFSRDARKPKFDTERHALWAAEHIERLVPLNEGSALVLAAKSESGKMYVDRLRAIADGRWEVHSQWDGIPLRQLINEWRDDHGSVLVGTKSLMTGVDAPGATCSLVIVDRIPRPAGNPVDDARVEIIMERGDYDRWTADRFVYVADAALLLEQAAGRLIRAVTDSGVVAILDPRLLKVGPFSYNEKSRNAYLEVLDAFPTKVSSIEAVDEFITKRRAATVA